MIELNIGQMAASRGKIKTEKVLCPEFAPEGAANPQDYGVYVYSMTIQERDSYENYLAEEARKAKLERVDNFRSRLIARTLCDEHGQRRYTDQHYEVFAELPAAPMSRIFDVAAKLNGFTDNDVKEQAETLKNVPTTSADSASPAKPA